MEDSGALFARVNLELRTEYNIMKAEVTVTEKGLACNLDQRRNL